MQEFSLVRSVCLVEFSRLTKRVSLAHTAAEAGIIREIIDTRDEGEGDLHTLG